MKKRIARTLSLFELMRMFPTEIEAIAYFERLRWGNKPHCVRCGSPDLNHKEAQARPLLVRNMPAVFQRVDQHAA